MKQLTDTTLQEVAMLIMGQSPDSAYYTKEPVGYKFLQGCAEFGKKYPKAALHCTHPNKIAPANSILFSVRAPVGRINLADDEYCIGRGLAAIVAETVELNYLYQYLLFKSEELRNVSQGSTFEAINSKELRQVSLKIIPSLAEQTWIAAVLSCVDRAIEQSELLIAKQHRIKTGLMHELLTKGIDEHGHIRSELSHSFKDSPIGRIPSEWEAERFGTACKKIAVGIATSTTKHFSEDGVPLIRNQNVRENGFDTRDILFITKHFDEANKGKRLKPLDIVIVRTGYPGLSCVVPDEMEGWQTFTTLICRPKQDRYNSHFVSLMINSHVCKRQIANLQAGGAQQNLNVGWITNMDILCPPREEQTQIVRILHSVAERIRNGEAMLSKFKRLKLGLMQDLLTGKIGVESLFAEHTAVNA